MKMRFDLFVSLLILSLVIFVNESQAQSEWYLQNSGTTDNLYDVCFIDSSIGVVLGANTILRTTDGGINWISQTFPGEFFQGIYFINYDNGIVVGLDGVILRTIDGGVTWIDQSVEVQNWLYDVYFIDVNTGFAVGLKAFGYWVEKLIMRTTNGGVTWSEQLFDVGNIGYEVYLTDNNTGYVAGTDGLHKTTNGGNTWFEIANTASSGIDFINSNTGVITGFENGFIYRTEDGGTNWTEVVDFGPGYVFDDVSFSGINTITAVGYKWSSPPFTRWGVIVRTEDGGISWTETEFQTGTLFQGVDFADEYIGTVVGLNGMILRRNCCIIPTSPTNLVPDVDTSVVTLNWQDNSFNEDGFVIERKEGDSVSINPFVPIATVGLNNKAYADTTINPNSTYGYRIYAFNSFGNSGYSNLVYVETPIPVELTAFTAEVSNNKVLLNWSTATETNNQGFEIERTSPHPSPYQGEGGEAGRGWEKIGSVAGFGTSTEPQSYSFTDDISNILTHSLTLSYRLKQIDYDGTFEYSDEVEVTLNDLPTEFALFQNYPNPFNPSTKIKYSVADLTDVNLAVYDILGREIKVLVNEKKEPGYYTVNFDSSNLSSGIYIYRIETRNYIKSHKMVLMK